MDLLKICLRIEGYYWRHGACSSHSRAAGFAQGLERQFFAAWARRNRNCIKAECIVMCENSIRTSAKLRAQAKLGAGETGGASEIGAQAKFTMQNATLTIKGARGLIKTEQNKGKKFTMHMQILRSKVHEE